MSRVSKKVAALVGRLEKEHSLELFCDEEAVISDM
jgi:hypothetical protein